MTQAARTAAAVFAPMEAERFKAIRTAAGLTLAEVAILLRMSDQRTVRRWERGDREISGPVSLLMELLESGEMPGDLIEGARIPRPAEEEGESDD